MMNDENPGSAGASPALFGALAEKLPMVSREARDTAREAARAPRFLLDFARNDKDCAVTCYIVTSDLRFEGSIINGAKT